MRPPVSRTGGAPSHRLSPAPAPAVRAEDRPPAALAFFPLPADRSSSFAIIVSTPVQPAGVDLPLASKRKREGTEAARRPYRARSEAQLIVSGAGAADAPSDERIHP